MKQTKKERHIIQFIESNGGMESEISNQVKIKEALISALKRKDETIQSESRKQQQYGDIEINTNPLDTVTQKESESAQKRNPDPQKLIKLAEQLNEVRDKLFYLAKITSKLHGKHTKSC